ncbi:MAG: signal peptidase I [Clostridia bacterium]|nr:signal peptidase I [Clostridia bacterium]
MNSNIIQSRPDVSQLEAELAHERHKRKYNRTLRSTVGILIVVAAAAVLLATIFFPVLRIYGSSMTPTVTDGEVVIAFNSRSFSSGDVTALWYGNKLLVKRIIASPGQWVNIDEDGNVFVDGQLLDEPYVSEKAFGDCNIDLPYQVPDGHYFVLGDHRNISQDSRNTAVGCIAKEQIVGRLLLRVWPLKQAGSIK